MYLPFVLSGTLHPSLGLAKNLRWVALSTNSIEGVLPPQLGSSKFLESVTLEDNRLTGMIPGSLVLSSSLQFLKLAGNRLEGFSEEWHTGNTSESQLLLVNISSNALEVSLLVL